MKNKFVNNKILLILLVFLLCVFILTTNIFASSNINCISCDTIVTTNLDYDFSNVSETGGKHLGLVVGAEYNSEQYIFAYWSYDSNYHNVKPYINNGVVFMTGTYNIMIYKVVDNSLVHQGWTGGLFEKNGFEDLGKNSTIYSTTSDIYTDSSYNKIFFQNPPQVEITEITQVEELPKIMNKALQVIIPVGLVVLSIGLLIYVVKSVILRKI